MVGNDLNLAGRLPPVYHPEADADGDPDGADFLAWQRQVGSGVSVASTSVAVPEPGSLILLLGLVLGGFCLKGSCRTA